MNIKEMDILRGASTSSDWQVFTERGLIHDIHTHKSVPGLVLHVGHIELTVTDEQAERLVDYIKGEFAQEERLQMQEWYSEMEASLRHRSFRDDDES